MAGYTRIPMMKKPFLLLVLILSCLGALLAEAPLAVAAPKKARARIVEASRAYFGVPYLYGGTTREGLDCSGLVWRVYIDTFGRAPLASLPRTAKDLFGFVEIEERSQLQPGDLVFFDTTGPLSHVGIYSGEGSFIHAASEGSKTGVIESSLSERYWSAHYSASGRILPPAEYLGIYLGAFLGPDLGPTSLDFHGISAGFGASYRLLGFEAGLELRPSWNRELGVARLPLVLSIGLSRDLRVFAGPALTLGKASMDGVDYEAGGSWLASVGAVWTPLRFKLAGQDMGLYAQVVYDRYLSSAGEENLGASLSAGMGLRFRLGF